MLGTRHTMEQKIRFLRETERHDGGREHQISEHTFHRWKREFEMLEVDQTKQPNARAGEAEDGVASDVQCVSDVGLPEDHTAAAGRWLEGVLLSGPAAAS